MIRSISVEGFKSIASLELELGRVNCFIGANGVGKSNVLEAIGVLGAAANGRVDDEALQRRGVRPGLPRLYKTAFADLQIRPHITLEATSSSGALYRVALLNPLEGELAWGFKTEKLSGEDGDLVSRGVRTDKTNLDPTAGLSALKAVELEPERAEAQLLRQLQRYAIYSPNTPTLRANVLDPQSRAPVGLAGGQLDQGLIDLRATLHAVADIHYAAGHSYDGPDMDSVLELIDWVTAVDATEAASMLLSPSVSRGQRVVQFTDRFMREGLNTLSAYDASEGALYVLFTAILCMANSSPRFFAIDNLDQSLNPRLITRLTERLLAWLRAVPTHERQLLFTAHNPAVLDGLDLWDDDVRLFAVERNSVGHTCVRRVVLTEAQHGLLEQYPLSRLWMMGALGALPNV